MDVIWQAIQAEFADVTDEREVTQILVRLLMAAVLGAVLGFEREHKGKSAGVRTHMLVSLGAALFVLAPSMAGADETGTQSGDPGHRCRYRFSRCGYHSEG